MTPQEIMDLPAYGMAEKQLRKQKNWRLDPSELLDGVYQKIDSASDAIRDAEHEIEKAYTALEGE